MTGVTVLIILTLICGFYVAWNIGANDVANAMGTSVGSGALTLTMAVVLAAIFEFAGAFIVGSNVSDTVRKKIFDPSIIGEKYGTDEAIVTLEVGTNAANPNPGLAAGVVNSNDPPQAIDDWFSIASDTELSGSVIANDADPNMARLTVKGIPEKIPTNGTVEIQSDGSFVYTPNPGFTGRDSFHYQLTDPADGSYILACGMIAALIAAGTWLLIATFMSWPVSTTHSIVGAVVGFGCIALGMEGIEWRSVGMISAGWVVAPVISGAISYLLFSAILKLVFHKRDPVKAAKKLTPYLVFLVVAVMAGVTTFKGLKPLWKQMGIVYDPVDAIKEGDLTFLYIVMGVTLAASLLGFFLSKLFLRNYASEEPTPTGGNPVLDAEVSRSLHKAQMHLKRVRSSSSDESVQKEAEKLLQDVERISKTVRERITTNTDSPELRKVEKIFVLLQIMTACLVAFAHGSNDVANAIGPLSAAYQALESGVIQAKSTTPAWALLLGGVGIVFGLATWGWRVIQTVGKKITELTPSRGFCAEFGAAITILVASTLPIGLPISTTHTLVGAVLGVGLARGINALNLKTMRDIVAGWAITIPAGAGLSVVFYLILKAVFVDSGWVS